VEFLQAHHNIHSVPGNKEGLNTLFGKNTKDIEQGTVSCTFFHCLWIAASSYSKVIPVNMHRQVEDGFITNTVLAVKCFLKNIAVKCAVNFFVLSFYIL
jgi:hypothetical protein